MSTHRRRRSNNVVEREEMPIWTPSRRALYAVLAVIALLARID